MEEAGAQPDRAGALARKNDHSAIRQCLRQILLEGYPTSRIREVADGDLLVREALQGGWDLVAEDH